MSAVEILTPDFLNDLPEDDRLAFSMIVQRAMEFVQIALSRVDESERSSWEEYRTAEYTAMNVIVASAKRLEIEPFASLTMPRRKQFDDDDFVQFRADLDHYVTQMLLDNGIRSRHDSVPVSGKAKEQIRTYVNAIKAQIDETEMTDGKRAALYDKLAAFEKELEKSRLPIFAMGRILMEILSISCNVLALSDSSTFQRLISQTMHVIAEAKAIDDDQRQLPPSEPPKMILPPRPAELKRKSGPSESYDLNDDIPF